MNKLLRKLVTGPWTLFQPGNPQAIRNLLFRWSVWLQSARLDRRIFLQALLQIDNDLCHWHAYPRIFGAYVPLFLQIGEKIDNLRFRKCHWRIIHIHLPNEVHLPVVPFNRGEPAATNRNRYWKQ